MTLEAVYMIGQTIAALCVVGSLVFVGLQIMANVRAVRSATAQAVHDNYAEWYLMLSGEPDALGVSIKGFRDYGSLTSIEKAQFICVFMAFLSHSQNAFYQWQAGALDVHLWTGWDTLIMYLVNTPGGAAFWRERAYVFGEAFQRHVEGTMKRAPPAGAKAFGVVPLRQGA